MATATQPVSEVGPVSNGGASTIEQELPYIVSVTITGTADILFHAWNVESIEEKSKAKKGSAAKKSDDVESYVYRNDKNLICIPTEYLRGSIIGAAKYRQDPRSPRKSAMDLFKAGIVSMEPLTPIKTAEGKTTDKWDFLHKCRVTVQRNGITRTRPAFHAGWSAEFSLMCNLPEYISTGMLNDVIQSAGKLIGLADFRPTFGRYQVVKFDVQEAV